MKRMDKAVLPFSLHCESSSKSSVVAELKEMLKAAASPAEAAIIECVSEMMKTCDIATCPHAPQLMIQSETLSTLPNATSKRPEKELGHCCCKHCLEARCCQSEGVGTVAYAQHLRQTRRKELEAALAGAEKKRRQRLKTVPIVGATCCATLLPALDNMVRISPAALHLH